MKGLKKDNRWSVSGFTLAEILLVLAIIVILGAVAVVSAVVMIRNIRQASSDKTAESLYTAVSAHLQEVWAFDYDKVETLDHADTAFDVSGDPIVIRYVAKDVGAAPGGDDKLDIVLGENGSAVGSDYYGDSIVVEYNPSSLQVYSVFYSSSVSPSQYYTSSGSAENSLDDLRNDVSKRRSEFNGYLGYYHADTQNLPELEENEYGVMVGLDSTYTGDTSRHLNNKDELTAPVAIHIPSEEYDNIDKLRLEVKVTGKESGAVARITYDEQDALNGGILKHYAADMLKTSFIPDAKMFTFEVVIDNLKDKNFKKTFLDYSPGPKNIIIRFLGMTAGADPQPVVMERKAALSLVPNMSGKLFTPGEDIEVRVSAIYADGVEMVISDVSKNLAADNSLYAYGSRRTAVPNDHYAAYLSYARHLQNLDPDISGMGDGLYTDVPVRAYLTDTIDFTKDGDKLWRKLYSDTSRTNPYDSIMPFTPIDNPNIEALFGDYRLSYNGGTHLVDAISLRAAGYVGETEHEIDGLIIRSTVTKPVNEAGLFASFGGGEIKNITLKDPRISGNGVTGGLVAKASLRRGKTLTIENCALYMTDDYCAPYFINDAPYGIVERGAGSNDPYIQDDSDVTGIWMSGNSRAGGLIGEFSHDSTDPSGAGAGPILTLKTSHASTVIDSSSSSGASGGLVGFVGGGAASSTINIDRCYADCYISGADTGGLIGRIAPMTTVDLSDVYTAGFEDGALQAGFANGTISSARSSYAFTQMSMGGTSRAFTTAAKINSTDGNVYYFPQVNTNSNNAARVTDADNTKSVEDIPSTGPNKSLAELLLGVLGSAFESDPGDTCPYNLRDGMALSTYTKPKLKNMVHYGDWQDEFTVGALCYYEKYVKTGSKIRFYGGNYNALYNNLQDGDAVAADGYGLVFKKNLNAADKPDSVKIKYEFAGASPVIETIDFATASYLEAEYDEQTYLIYKIDTDIVNYKLNADSPFYTKAEITYVKDGADLNTDVYYFNPHFARAVGYLGTKDDSTVLTVPELRPNGVIYIRSARHLYDLSLYYGYYRAATEGRVFRQTYDISYTDYDWHGYYDSRVPDGSCIVRQNPIGITKAESFKATYNGGCYKIRNISFVLETGRISGGTFYTGLFGYNEGDIRNIVLFADYDDYDTASVQVNNFTENNRKHYYADRNDRVYHYAGTDEDISKNSELYLGILAGANAGTIYNCATAGYCMADSRGTIVGNSNGYIYAGGMAGENMGSISNSSADTPQIRLTTTYTTAYMGGFTGRNTGKISDSYSLGHIEVVNPRGGSIVLAGFAARNSGDIASSYAAENIRSSGNTSVYGFCPQGGSVRGCDYLSNGTFAYVGHLYSYRYPLDKGAGTPRTRDDLINQAKSVNTVMTGNSEDYTAYKDGSDYPFRAVVTDMNRQYIHYGDWQRDPGMGDYGVFYWEKEEGRGNNGYHFSYVGVDTLGEIAGSTLCNAHDDDGIIVDYGYGYYVKHGLESSVTSTTVGLQLPADSLSDVAGELAKEVANYTFYPYRTLTTKATTFDDYLYLSSTGDEVDGLWKLTKDGTEKSFCVAPFFANAISIVNGNEPELIVISQDGINKTDHVFKPGTEKNPYEIRTVEQLQFINWNAYTRNVSSIATEDPNVYKAFPYLAYASVTGVGKQTKGGAGHNQTLKFLQTHDVSGLDKNGNAVIPNYTPIASTQSANGLDREFDATLYAWFGSDYNGQSYKITNINISSPAFSVGVFGVTVSAGLQNIILYSDRDCVIERNNGSDMTAGGYCIGGLVGIAYKYSDAAAGTGNIYNCAVAGYKIKDQSTNQQTIGGGNVGGLVGASTVNVVNCSAVTDIEINCTHQHNSDKATHNGHAYYGDYVRTGGLAGALPGEARNCYSGGSIRVGDATLAESRDKDGNFILQDEEAGKVCHRAFSMNVYIGGIAGSAYTVNYQNFTGALRPNDGSPTMTNCYTYVDLPELRGSIRAVTMIASLADRYGNVGTSEKYRVNIYNCHYLDNYDRSKVDNAAKYTIFSENSAVGTVSPYDALHQTTNFYYKNETDVDSGETYFENMLRGGGTYPSLITGYDNGRMYERHYDIDVHPSPESHDQLSGKGNVLVHNRTTRLYDIYDNIEAALNGSGTGTFGWVTVSQPNGSNIDGKYSFPGNSKALDGLNYPFPTIVTQRDIVFNRNVNVHYGVWPISGMYWSEARSEMDIFGDRSADGFAYKELQILKTGSADLTTASFDMEVGGIVEIESVTRISEDSYSVKFKALKTGTETITAGGTAKLILEVKADFSVSTVPATVTVSRGEVQVLDLKASAISTPDPVTGATSLTDCSDSAVWSVTIRDNGGAYVGYIDNTPGQYQKTYPVGTHSLSITGADPGKTQIVVDAILNYNGTDYESSLYLSLQTYGVIGMSNHGLGSTFGGDGFRNETSRASDGTNNGNDNPDFVNSPPSMNDDGWADLYIYESYADEALGSMNITEISINGDTISNVTDDGSNMQYTAGGYILDIGSASAKMSADRNYRYRSLKIRPETGAGGDATVSITLKDGETDAYYVLSGTLTVTNVVVVSSNEPVTTAEKASLSWKSLHAGTDGNVDLYNGGLPVLAGYSFGGWNTVADGSGNAYCTGADHSTDPVINIAGDTELYAIWTPISYTVSFDPGLGQINSLGANLDDVVTTYDTDVWLYDKPSVDAKYDPPTAGGSFTGWNTVADGSGIAYKPGAVVNNLIDHEETTPVVMYAQWRDHYRLTFMDYKDGIADPEGRSVDVPAGDSAYQTGNDEVFGDTVQWSDRNGTYGYYWTSSVGTTYRLVGWDTNRRKDPSAVAYMIADDGSGNPIFPVIDAIEGDGTYYAIWEEMGYSITLIDTLTGVTTTYDNLSGSLKSIGDITGYTTPACTGYKFEGWYTDRIANGGEQYAGNDNLFKEGKKLADLLAGTYSVTLYARYSEVVYIRLTTNNLKNGYDYLIGVTEYGTSAGVYSKRFSYLVTDATTGFHSTGNKDLAGIDHAFRDSGELFYTNEIGGAVNKMDSVTYMDTVTMPTDVYNPNRDATVPIGADIPANAVWTWSGTGNTGTFALSGQSDKYLNVQMINNAPHLAVGDTSENWNIIPKSENESGGTKRYYAFVQSTSQTQYYLHCNYWNFNLYKGTGDKNCKTNFYEKTTVYLDEKPQ